jgi:hypothetical protein
VAARVRVQREGSWLLFVGRRRYLGVRARSRGGRRRSRRGGRYAGEERGGGKKGADRWDCAASERKEGERLRGSWLGLGHGGKEERGEARD